MFIDMEIQQYFYFIGTTFLLPIWIWLFSKKDKRSDMLFIGIYLGIAAVIFDQFYAMSDYWKPVFMIPSLPFESFYYGFIYGGISAELYELIMNKRNSIKRIYHPYKKGAILYGILIVFSFWFAVDVLKINSIVAGIVPQIILGIVSIVIHHEMWKSAIINALALTILTFITFQFLLIIYPNIFIDHWYLSKFSGVFIFSIPIEELLFAFAVGFGIANAYELMCGYKIVNNKSKKVKRK